MEVQFIVNSNNQSRQCSATKWLRKTNSREVIVTKRIGQSHCLQQFTSSQIPNSSWPITANCTQMQSCSILH